MESVEFEPQTWTYEYDITGIQYRDERGDWFVLDHSIPDESRVIVEDNPDSEHVWRNGTVHKIEIEDFELLVERESDKDNKSGERTGAVDEGRAPVQPLSERLANTVRSIRPCGMHCLVVLEGKSAPRIINQEHPSLAPYLPLILSAGAIEANSATLVVHKWPLPQDGEVALVALDRDGRLLGTERLTFNDLEDAATQASNFIKKHRAPARDARVQLAAARADAMLTNRKI